MTSQTGDFELEKWMEDRRLRVEAHLERALDRLREGTQPRLFEAMRYSLMAGGKRLRPMLVLEAATAVDGGETAVAVDFACALEMVHTYSLIHDDLPAMDDDDFRRGRPTCHKVFGEAMAILAGDGLLTEAFGVLAGGDEPVRARLAAMLAKAAGTRGMVGGQAGDIREDRPATIESLDEVHRRKTGALIAASCAGGALAGGGSPGQVAGLLAYGQHLGLAFQIQDDVIDVTGDAARMGKAAGSDARKGKLTYPALLGLERARERAREQARLAKEAAAGLPAPRALLALADFVVARDR